MSPESVISVLQQAGLSPGFIGYIAKLYKGSSPVVEVQVSRSETIKFKRGVRQGNPPFLPFFCDVINGVLISLSQEVGYELGESQRLVEIYILFN